jgi:hypothetical protein
MDEWLHEMDSKTYRQSIALCIDAKRCLLLQGVCAVLTKRRLDLAARPHRAQVGPRAAFESLKGHHIR